VAHGVDIGWRGRVEPRPSRTKFRSARALGFLAFIITGRLPAGQGQRATGLTLGGAAVDAGGRWFLLVRGAGP